MEVGEQGLFIKIDNVSNEQRKKELEKLFTKCLKKFGGASINECTRTELNYEITGLLKYIEDNYPEEKITCDFSGGVAYHEEIWTLNDILEAYKKCYPKRYDKNKKEYTRREVNNILFALQTIGYIQNHTPIAYPDCPSNNELFEGMITVQCQFIAKEYWSKIEEEE